MDKMKVTGVGGCCVHMEDGTLGPAKEILIFSGEMAIILDENGQITPKAVYDAFTKAYEAGTKGDK